jgi:hypothetical protein
MKYKDWRPTPLDIPGAFLSGRDEWKVMRNIRHRDSSERTCQRFNAAVARLGGESKTVEVHRFGHWMQGWFEIILVSPEHRKENQA